MTTTSETDRDITLAETGEVFSAITLRGWTATGGSLDAICWLGFRGADGDFLVGRFCCRYLRSATNLPNNAIAVASGLESVAQNVSKKAIAQARPVTGFASSTAANIINGNGQRLEQLPSSQSFQASASNSNILFQDWQLPSMMWIEPTDGGAVFIDNNWYRGKLLLIA